MESSQISIRFALESPTPECFSALAAAGKVATTSLHNHPQSNVTKMTAALTDDAANTMWEGRKTPADVASFIALHTTDKELLTNMLRIDRRITVIAAAFANPLTPLEDLLEHTAVQPLVWTNVNDEARRVVISRFAAMSTTVAFQELCNGLPGAVYAAVAGRPDVTLEVARPYLSDRWTYLRNDAHDGCVPLIHHLCKNPTVALQWPHDVLADMVAAPGVSPSLVAYGLILNNPALVNDDRLCALMVDAACQPVASPAMAGDDRHDALAGRLAAIASLPAAATAQLAAASTDPNHPTALLLAGHPNADPLWWSNIAFQSCAGAVAAGRILAADVRFHDPGLWSAAHAMADSWNGNVIDFVAAVTDLFATTASA